MFAGADTTNIFYQSGVFNCVSGPAVSWLIVFTVLVIVCSVDDRLTID